MLTRAHLRQRAVAALKAAHTLAGQRVFSPRDWPTWHNDYPVLLVQTPRERKESVARGVPQFTTICHLAVTARVEAASAEAAEADLETLCGQIEAALLTDYELISHLQQIASVETRLEVTAETRSHIGEAQLDFGLEFYEVFDPITPSSAVPPLDGIDVHPDLQQE